MGFPGFGKKSDKGGASGMTAAKVKDPVCGMMIDPKTAAGKSDCMGKTY